MHQFGFYYIDLELQFLKDVSGQRVGPIFNSQGTAWALNMGSIYCLEMSVTNYSSMLHRIPKKLKSEIRVSRGTGIARP